MLLELPLHMGRESCHSRPITIRNSCTKQMFILMKVIDLNILVIGNGFDLAMGWPTKYADFLNFIKLFRFAYNTEDYQKARIPKDCIGDFNNRMDRYTTKDEKEKLEKLKPFWDRFINAFKSEEANQVFRDFHFCIYRNRWIEYFEYRYDRQLIAGENWIDLEKEIKDAIKVLENDAIKIDVRNYSSMEINTIDRKIEEIIAKIQTEKNKNRKIHISTKTYLELRNKLREEFDKFVMALGIYLDFFVKHIYTGDIVPDDISNLVRKKEGKIDHVLSFNYVNNYNKYSGINENENNTCYVHGAVNYIKQLHKYIQKNQIDNYNQDTIKEIIEKNKMIIGFDEYRDDDAKNKQLDFIYYRKYFQRILKGTGSQYLKWLGQNELNNIYIFGCSLDATDKEIIKDLFLRKPVHTKIKIYYHDEEAHKRMITNLISILTQEKVIEMTSGINPDIEFVAQTSGKNNTSIKERNMPILPIELA